jgi:hypothetical protein
MKIEIDSPVFRCGKHSGFPVCCILWYMYIWDRIYVRWFDDIGNVIPKYKYSFARLYGMLLDRIIGWRKITHSFVNGYDGMFIRDWPGYGRIPCPFCLFFSKKKHNVLPCDCSKGCS